MLSGSVANALVTLEQIKSVADVTDVYITYADAGTPNVSISSIMGAISRLSSILNDELLNLDSALFKVKSGT